jgi:uncharacterized protein involved in outer membrane biogenesis
VNSFLLSLAVLLIVALSALFAVPYFIDVNAYRPQFEAEASKLLGRQVRVGGPIHLELLPVPELRFDRFAVADENGRFQRPLLTARSVQASLNIGSLLRGVVEARQLEFVDPVLSLEFKPDGTGNWSDVGPGARPVGFAPMRIALDSVTVSGGRIEIAKPGMPPLVLQKLRGQASAQSLYGPYKVSVDYEVGGRPQRLRFSTGQPDTHGAVHLKAVLQDAAHATTVLLDGRLSGLAATPRYEGSLAANVAPPQPAKASAQSTPSGGPSAIPTAIPVSPAPAPQPPAELVPLLALKGHLTATPQHASLDRFDMTLHKAGRSQTLKGRLAMDLGPSRRLTGQVSSGWIDLDGLFAPKRGGPVSPSAVLGRLVSFGLQQAATVDQANVTVTVAQVSLGGDLVGNVDLDLAAADGALQIGRLTADLPGETKLQASGRIEAPRQQPEFDGAVDLSGSKLRTLTRWAIGDRELPGQTASGDFALSAKLRVSPARLSLDDVKGTLSGTKFQGRLRFDAGKTRSLYLTLNSDRLDLRDVFGPSFSLAAWLPRAAAATTKSAQGANIGPSAPPKASTNPLAGLSTMEAHVALHAGTLLLPDAPAGSLDADLVYANDTLHIATLNFVSPGAVSLNASGQIDQLSKAPAGQLSFALSGQKPQSLKVVAELLGLPDRVSRTDYLARLAPLDLKGTLKADRQQDTTDASLDIAGTANGASIAVHGTALGNLDRLADARIDAGGSVQNADSEALLGALFPGLAAERLKQRLAALPQSKSGLNVTLSGTPNRKMTGSIKLIGPVNLSFTGDGSLQGSALSLNGDVAAKTDDAALLIGLSGLEVPPSAKSVPVTLDATLSKQAKTIDLAPVSLTLGKDSVQGEAHLRFSAAGPEFSLDANADSLSLPSLLGVLVAWERTPSTEQILGSITQGTAAVWPARGFALAPLSWARAQVDLKAKTLLLGEAFPLRDAELTAETGAGGLVFKTLSGTLFGGKFSGSATLSPRGEGAHLDAHATLASAGLAPATGAIAGKPLAQGKFGLDCHVSGEGLSPPGLVAGLSGGGTLTLRRGTILSLDAGALERMVADAAKANENKVDQKRVMALGATLRRQITLGRYPFATVTLPFDIGNGTVRLSHAKLANSQAVTDVNTYLALASLRLDSEWKMRLKDKRASDLPPVSIVLAGPLQTPNDITPSVDTSALEGYFTVERMQQDVERLENLDVTGGQGTAEPRSSKPQSSGHESESSEHESPNQTNAPLPDNPPPSQESQTPLPGANGQAQTQGQASESSSAVAADGQANQTPPRRPLHRHAPHPIQPQSPSRDWLRSFDLFGG